LPRGINKKLKCKTKNKMVSATGPVQSYYHEGRPVGKRSLRSYNIRSSAVVERPCAASCH